MFKKVLPLLLVLATMLVPGFAHADTLHPINGNAWTLYVFGNGDAVFNILNAIKLLMIPDSGETGFNSLLMFLATLGFLVLAVQAGFDPSKNLMRMFSYIIVVSSVHITTMQITANIHISDPVTNYDNVVPGVPALVGVPAALVSEVGHWFTRTVETYYTIPSEMTVSGGTFNLFGKLMQESNEFVISSPELKKSLSAYTADCTVPAMAQGRISATDLMTAANMTDVLAKASHKAIMTKYFPVGKPNTSGTGVAYISEISFEGVSYPVQGGLGAIVPCEAAWGQISADLEAHGTELMNATAQAWAKTGVLVPFEAGMSAAMAMASNGGANGFANYSRPQGYILQQAMLNSMAGNFRSAAASIGNNEILMAASIAQAEQSQKSSWFTAARVFTNMMGYVYTTLQAFIFAIVPIVIIALMVPGLGKSIFTNYAQILVWLMLWQPMLSIVNFLITLFGKAQIASAMELAHGVTMQNKWLLQESTNDLMLAAQFLGTSVPLLTWGLVKGSLAFTEFISHGIGSSMAQQAGATAATGNLSMGNMSMDNTSMNKFNTAMSSAVGNQTTMGYTGAMQTSTDLAGDAKQAMGGAISVQNTKQLSAAQQASYSSAISSNEQAQQALSALHNLSKGNGFDISNSEQRQLARSAIEKLSESAGHARSAGDNATAKRLESAASELGRSMLQQAQSRMGMGVRASATASGGLEILGTGVKTSVTGEASAGVDWSNANARNEAFKVMESIQRDGGQSVDNKFSSGSSAGKDNTVGNTNTAGSNMNQSTNLKQDWSQSTADSVTHALAASKSVGSSMSYTLSTGQSSSAMGRASVEQFDQLNAVGAGLQRDVPSKLDAAGRETGGSGLADPTAAGLKKEVQRVTDVRGSSPSNAAAGATSHDQKFGKPHDVSIPTGGQDAHGAFAGAQRASNEAIRDAELATGNNGTVAQGVGKGRKTIEDAGAPANPTAFGGNKPHDMATTMPTKLK
jgi:hypothetical protein